MRQDRPCARVERPRMRNGEPTQNTVLGLVVKRLYFGRRPSQSEMAQNGSVLKRLHRYGHSWDSLAKVVEGLARRRDRGELGTIGSTDPVSLLWLVDKGHIVNQVTASLDAYYRLEPATRKGIQTLRDIMANAGKGKS